MLITVAICTWNRAALLEQTLQQLTALEPPSGAHWELLVVNNASTDHTDDVLAGYANKLPLRRIHEQTPGLSNARNRALAETGGEWIVWTDDDVLVHPGWLAALCSTARRQPKAAAIGGPVEPWFEQPPDSLLASVFPAVAAGFCGVNHGETERILAPGEDLYGANMAFNRHLTRDLRFDPRLGRRGSYQGGGEDLAFVAAARLRGPIVWSPAMRVRHYVDPRRMTAGFMRRVAIDAGEQHVQVSGVPVGPRFVGIPRWLLGDVVRRTASVIFRWLGGDARALLETRRDLWFVLGTIRGCWRARTNQTRFD
jgi:glycosyltransferase involved in cell wall biosynthesis